jgi:hypothetical protein
MLVLRVWIGLAITIYLHRMWPVYGNFLAKNTVCTLHIPINVWFWPTLRMKLPEMQALTVCQIWSCSTQTIEGTCVESHWLFGAHLQAAALRTFPENAKAQGVFEVLVLDRLLVSYPLSCHSSEVITWWSHEFLKTPESQIISPLAELDIARQAFLLKLATFKVREQLGLCSTKPGAPSRTLLLVCLFLYP